MSDESVVSAAAPAAAEVTAGTLLRQAREASGLHVAALAVAMKVPVKKLEALEADRLQDLPDAVFVRALAASVCRTLKVDPSPILNKLPQSVAPRFEADDRGINTPFRSHAGYHGGSLKSFATKPAVLAVLALLLGALVVLFFPEQRHVEPAVVPPVAASADAASPVETAPGDATQAPAAPAPLANVPAVVVANDGTNSVSSAQVPAKMASAVSAASAAPAVAIPTVIAFKAKSEAWVRVTDANGTVQFEKTLKAGETGAAGGELPLAVVVGNVSATEVELRGQPFSLEALNKNNVARFEVK